MLGPNMNKIFLIATGFLLCFANASMAADQTNQIAFSKDVLFCSIIFEYAAIDTKNPELKSELMDISRVMDHEIARKNFSEEEYNNEKKIMRESLNVSLQLKFTNMTTHYLQCDFFRRQVIEYGYGLRTLESIYETWGAIPKPFDKF
jgi:hypothetical protein